MISTRKVLEAAAACLLCVCTAAAVAADKKGSNADAKRSQESSPSASAVSAAATASALVRYGDANKDALALITAARMLKQAGLVETQFKRTSGQAGDAKAQQDAGSVDAILARARTLAGSDASLVALADDVAKGGSRGAVGGPKSSRTVVRSRATDVFTVSFVGGEPARVLVSGDGDSDLDLYIHDQNGNLICKDDDHTDDMVCGWRPRWTGPFQIRVVNRGVANQYRIVTN